MIANSIGRNQEKQSSPEEEFRELKQVWRPRHWAGAERLQQEDGY